MVYFCYGKSNSSRKSFRQESVWHIWKQAWWNRAEEQVWEDRSKEAKEAHRPRRSQQKRWDVSTSEDTTQLTYQKEPSRFCVKKQSTDQFG